MDPDIVPQEWVGEAVVVYLANAEADGVEILATLDEVDGDGIKISHIGELGPGPLMFCPWATVRRVELQRPESPAPAPSETELLEYTDGELADEPEGAFEESRRISAQTLERVIPVAQKQTVEGVTVALTSLELYGEGWGVLRWLASFRGSLSHLGGDPGIPEPWFEIRDDTGYTLAWLPQGAGTSDGESDGNVQVEGLPNTGELEIEVTHLVTDAYEDGEYRGLEMLCEGPWTFRLNL